MHIHELSCRVASMRTVRRACITVRHPPHRPHRRDRGGGCMAGGFPLTMMPPPRQKACSSRRWYASPSATACMDLLLDRATGRSPWMPNFGATVTMTRSARFSRAQDPTIAAPPSIITDAIPNRSRNMSSDSGGSASSRGAGGSGWPAGDSRDRTGGIPSAHGDTPAPRPPDGPQRPRRPGALLFGA